MPNLARQGVLQRVLQQRICEALLCWLKELFLQQVHTLRKVLRLLLLRLKETQTYKAAIFRTRAWNDQTHCRASALTLTGMARLCWWRNGTSKGLRVCYCKKERSSEATNSCRSFSNSRDPSASCRLTSSKHVRPCPEGLSSADLPKPPWHSPGHLAFNSTCPTCSSLKIFTLDSAGTSGISLRSLATWPLWAPYCRFWHKNSLTLAVEPFESPHAHIGPRRQNLHEFRGLIVPGNRLPSMDVPFRNARMNKFCAILVLVSKFWSPKVRPKATYLQSIYCICSLKAQKLADSPSHASIAF